MCKAFVRSVVVVFLVLCCESEEDLRAMVGRFAEVCSRRGMNVTKEGLECEVHVDGIHLEHVSEFKFLGCILDEAECSCKRHQVPS